MEDPAKDISDIVRILLSGGASERQDVLENCFTADVVFDHPLVRLRGRSELFDLYQYWHSVNFKIGVKIPKIVLSQDKDRLALDIDETIHPFFFPFFPTIIRLIVFLDLQRTPNGYVISRQEDHIIWTESIQRSFPVLHHVWYTYVTRWTGLAIVYIMRATGYMSRLLAHRVVPKLPKNSAIQQSIISLHQSLDSKLTQKWNYEARKLG